MEEKAAGGMGSEERKELESKEVGGRQQQRVTIARLVSDP